MKYQGEFAYAAQLAELLEGVLKLGGHLADPPGDVVALIEAARCVVEAGPQLAPVPVVIVSLEGGTIVESYGTHPARVIFPPTNLTPQMLSSWLTMAAALTLTVRWLLGLTRQFGYLVRTELETPNIRTKKRSHESYKRRTKPRLSPSITVHVSMKCGTTLH